MRRNQRHFSAPRPAAACMLALFLALAPVSGANAAPKITCYFAEVRAPWTGAHTMLVNGHILVSEPGKRMPPRGLEVSEFLVAGKNAITLLTPQATLAGLRDGDTALTLGLTRQVHYFPAQPVLSRTFTRAESRAREDDRLFAFIFENPSPLDNSDIVLHTPRRNDTPERFAAMLPKMRAFAVSMHEALFSGNQKAVTDAARISIQSKAANLNTRREEVSVLISDWLAAIRKRPGYVLADPDQIVFLPSCEGRLWRVVVMNDAERGRALQDSVKALPCALPAYDHELLTGRSEKKGELHTLPIHIAFVEGKFVIVRHRPYLTSP